MDTLYRDKSIPQEYKYIIVDGDIYYFFDNVNVSLSNGYYFQRYVQGAYITDFSSATLANFSTAKEVNLSNDYVYRCDFHHICFVYLFVLLMLYIGIKIITRFIYHKGI